MSDAQWICVRQRAGPLTKECRALRPRLSKYDSREDRQEKNEILRSQHTAVDRTSVDHLELRLALFGFEGTHYTLTYDDYHLPGDFSGVRRSWRSFMERAKRCTRDRLITSCASRAAMEITATTSMWCCGTGTSRQQRCAGSGGAATWMTSRSCSRRADSGGWPSTLTRNVRMGL